MAEHARRAGGQITDEDLRWAYLRSRAQGRQTTNWPPPRNAVCRCDFARKDKKCCGRRSV